MRTTRFVAVALVLTTPLLAAVLSAQQTSHPKSSVQLLMLTDEQATRLDQLWDYVSGVRFDEEAKLAKKGEKARDEDRQATLKRISKALDNAQKEAAKLLRDYQKELAQVRRDELRLAPDNGAKQLLGWTLSEFMAAPVDESAARRWRAAREAQARLSQASPYYRYRSWGYGFGGHGWHYGWHTGSHGTHIGWHHGHHGGHSGGH